jgi:hypothetical protein
MKRFKKIFTSAVMFMTVVVMSGLTAPATSAATAQAGDLIKKDGLSAVYYLGEDGKRYVFPNESTYKSWYSDFSSVITVSSDELAIYPLGANVVVRPGTKLVKITTDPKVYAVEENGTLRWVQTEEDAIALYGDNWSSRVIDVADSFFTNYTIGEPLTSDEVPQGSLVQKEGESEVYYFDGSDYRMIEDEVAFLANRFQFENVLTINDFTPSGTTITGSEASISKTSQTGAATGWQPGQGTGVTVALNSTTPASQSVPQTVGRVPFAKVNVTASTDGETHLESITVKRTGLTTNPEGIKVWAEKDGAEVSSKRSLSSDEALLTFASNIVIPAGETIVLDILAELDDVTGNGALGIASASAVSAAGATVSGSFPITGNTMSFTDYNVTEIDFATTKQDYSYKYKVGEEEVELGRFDIEISDNERDIVFDSIVLRNNGVEDLESVLMNVKLEANGEVVEVVSENATFNGRYATFTLSDGGYEILKDDSSQSFIVKGDVIAKDNSSDSDSLDLRLHKAEDISAYEKSTGFGVSFAHGGDIEVSTIMITSGVVSVSKKSTSPSDESVIKGSKDVVALIANIKADEAIAADGLNVSYSGTTGTTSASFADSFNNAKVYLNGALLGSFDLASSTETELIDSALNLNAGNNEVKITVDVKTNATPADYVEFVLDGSDLLDLPEYVSNGISVDTEDDISGTATGAQITVEGGDLTVTRNDGYADGRKEVEGASDVSLGKFYVKATNDNAKITSITLSENVAASGTSTDEANVYDMKLFVDGEQVDGEQIGTTRNLTASGATFSSLNYSIAKDTTKIIELKGSFNSDAADVASTSLKLNVDVYAQDSLGKTIEDISQVSTAQFEITSGGSLTIDKGPNSPYSDVLIAKADVEQEVAEFRLTAKDDDATITELVLQNGTPTSTSTDARISELKLYDGTKLLDSSVMIEGEASFKISGENLKVSADASKVITVKAIFNSIELEGETGEELALVIQDGSVVAKASSGSELEDVTIGDASANTMVIRKTKPTFAKESGIIGGSSIEQEMLRFNVTADTNEDISIEKLVFDLNGTGVANLGTIGIYEVGNSTILATTSTSSEDVLVMDVEISAGATKTFKVVADTAEIGTGKTVGVSLSNSTVGNIVWGEYFVGGNATTTGEYLEEFPIDGGTMKY